MGGDKMVMTRRFSHVNNRIRQKHLSGYVCHRRIDMRDYSMDWNFVEISRELIQMILFVHGWLNECEQEKNAKNSHLKNKNIFTELT